MADQADQTPDKPDGRIFMGIPGWVWDRLFFAFAASVIGWLTHTNTATIQDSTEKQVKAHEELKTEVKDGLSNVAAKVEETKPATPVGPRTTTTNIVGIEVKGGDVKPAATAAEADSDAKPPDDKPSPAPDGLSGGACE